MSQIIKYDLNKIVFEGDFFAFAEVARELGILDEVQFFYCCVRIDFNRIRDARPDMNGTDIEYILAEKHSRAQGTIHNILYPGEVKFKVEKKLTKKRSKR